MKFNIKNSYVFDLNKFSSKAVLTLYPYTYAEKKDTPLLNNPNQGMCAGLSLCLIRVLCEEMSSAKGLITPGDAHRIASCFIEVIKKAEGYCRDNKSKNHVEPLKKALSSRGIASGFYEGFSSTIKEDSFVKKMTSKFNVPNSDEHIKKNAILVVEKKEKISELEHSLSVVLNEIKLHQMEQDSYFDGLSSVNEFIDPDGSDSIDFGLGLLSIYCSETHGVSYGSVAKEHKNEFLSVEKKYNADHMGLAMWNANSAFVFDPARGLILVEFERLKSNSELYVLIDTVLDEWNGIIKLSFQQVLCKIAGVKKNINFDYFEKKLNNLSMVKKESRSLYLRPLFEISSYPSSISSLRK